MRGLHAANGDREGFAPTSVPVVRNGEIVARSLSGLELRYRKAPELYEIEQVPEGRTFRIRAAGVESHTSIIAGAQHK